MFFENLCMDAIVAEFSVFESFLKGLTVMTDTRLALCDVRGPLNDLNDKLSGEEGPEWLSGYHTLLVCKQLKTGKRRMEVRTNP